MKLLAHGFAILRQMPPSPDVRHQSSCPLNFLAFDQLARSAGVDPEAGRNQDHQSGAKQQAALAFEAGFAEQLFQTAIINHRNTFENSPPTLNLPCSAARVFWHVLPSPTTSQTIADRFSERNAAQVQRQLRETRPQRTTPKAAIHAVRRNLQTLSRRSLFQGCSERPE